jgi:hypothetical protein
VLQKQIEQLISPGHSQLSHEANVQQESTKGQIGAPVGPKQQQQQQQPGVGKATAAVTAATAALAAGTQQGGRGHNSAQEGGSGSGSSDAAAGSSSSGGGSGDVPGDTDVGAWLVRCSVLLEKLSGGLMAAGGCGLGCVGG